MSDKTSPQIEADLKYAYIGDMPTILDYSESRDVCLRQAFIKYWAKCYGMEPGYEYFEVDEENGTMSFDVSFLYDPEESKFDVYLFKIIDDPNVEGQQVLMITQNPVVWAF